MTSLSSNNWLRLHSQSTTMDATAEASISLDNRGLSYADGFFTTMGVIDGAILWLDYHQQRLISHARALQLRIDSKLLLVSLQFQAQQLQQGIIKLIVTRTAQAVRGYGFSTDDAGSACDIWLKASAMPISTSEHLILPNKRPVLVQPATQAICLTSQIACLPSTLAGLKSLNRLDNVLASGELQRIKANFLDSNPNERFGEGLLRDMTGNWVEGTMSNVFYRLSKPTSSKLQSSKSKSHLNSSKNNSNYLSVEQWYTPSMSQSGVAGVMRQVIIDALSTTKMPIIIRPLADADLPNLTQMFFCNAVRGVMPMNDLTLLSGEIVSF